MNILIFFLSFVLVLACLFLILLVLVQLPKKEAGLGQAFGSGATDALFGPGSGNMLTKMTKWTAAVFFVLTLLIWIMQGHSVRAKGIDPRSKMTAAQKAALDEARTPAAAPSTNISTISTNLPLATNAPLAKPPTNAPATNPSPAK